MLERNTNRGWIGGVAAGLAEQYGISAVLLRILFFISFFLFGFGLAVYAWLWLNMPEQNNTIRMNFSS